MLLLLLLLLKKLGILTIFIGHKFKKKKKKLEKSGL